jgi:phosphatidylinositol alpha-1,6-mannosyltransferase
MATADALLVTSSFLPGRGGIESYLAELCGEVAPRLAVLAPALRDGKPLPDDLPYRTIGYPGQMVVPGRGAIAAIDRAAQELEVDRVLFGTPWPLTLIGPRTAALGYRYAFIVYAAELYVPTTVPGLRRYMLETLSGSDFILTVSHYTTRRLTSMLERNNLRVPPMERLPARVDLKRFHPDVDVVPVRERLGLTAEDRVILCFGRLVTRKGIHRVIDALPAIARRVPNAVLVVAGAGPEEKNLRKQAAAARVVFAGRVPEADAPAYFALADVFALPVADRYFGREVEGLGVVMLEAGAAGTPSVIGTSGGSPETVVDGETGYVIDARDRSALADRIAMILEDPERRTAMGAAARRFVEEEFAGAPLPGPLVEWLDEASGTTSV